MPWLRRPPRVVERAEGEPPAVALTFDDGPSRWTAAIAASFERNGCHATFFLRGPEVERRPDAVAALSAAGHELGNHLWTHSDASTQTPREIRAELRRTSAAVRAAGGHRPVLARPPYCKAPDRVARAAAGTGIRVIVQRSVAPEDWRADTPDPIVERVLATVGPGDIVCLHDGVSPDPRDTRGREATAAAVERIVPALVDRGLRPVTVSHLLARR